MSPNASGRDKQSLSYIIRSGLAGGVAGSVAKTVVAPLDRVKILFQASNPDFQKYAGSWKGAFLAGVEIYRGAGIRGLFQGHSATLVRIFPYASIKFMTYDQLEHILMPTKRDETNLRRFTAGALSGIISVFFTYPLEILRVRMAYQTQGPNTGFFQTGTFVPTCSSAFWHIYHEGSPPPPSSPVSSSSISSPVPAALITRFPLLKFYRGFSVTIIGMVPYAGVSFLTWGFLRSHFVQHEPGKKPSTPIADLTIGAISGAIAQTISYPFEVVRRRMQVGGITQPDRWLSWNGTVMEIWKSSGWRGFFVGLGIGYLKMIPMTAVSFAVWQSMKRTLDL